jgi:hypothetical protein
MRNTRTCLSEYGLLCLDQSAKKTYFKGEGLMSVAFNYKETRKAFHLYTYKDNKVFSNLFVQIWRVPEIIPSSIGVEILYEDEFVPINSGGYYFYRDNPQSRYQDIIWEVKKNKVNTRTVRYDAEGNGNRPFHSIYIPYDIYLSERPVPNRLQVMIKWF